MDFLHNLSLRNPSLFIFGTINIFASLIFIVLPIFSKIQVRGVNAWYKPFKFCASVGIYSFSMGWITYSLPQHEYLGFLNWSIIILLGFENIYIAIQAGRGLSSHYNFSTPFSTFLFQIMGIAAALIALLTGYIGVLFLTEPHLNLPSYYQLSIELGLFLFVVFAFEGAAMGARGTHTVGGSEGGPSLPVLNWSTRLGDLRIAHFIGMHALQVLPILSWYILKNVFLTLLAGVLYAALAVYILVIALKGRSPFSPKALRMEA